MTAYEMRMSDWSSDVCSSDLIALGVDIGAVGLKAEALRTFGQAIDVEEAGERHLGALQPRLAQVHRPGNTKPASGTIVHRREEALGVVPEDRGGDRSCRREKIGRAHV